MKKSLDYETDLIKIQNHLSLNKLVRYSLEDINSNFLITVFNDELFDTWLDDICIITPIISIQKAKIETCCCLVLDPEKNIQILFFGISSFDNRFSILKSMKMILQDLNVQYIILMDVAMEKYFQNSTTNSQNASNVIFDSSIKISYLLKFLAFYYFYIKQFLKRF